MTAKKRKAKRKVVRTASELTPQEEIDDRKEKVAAMVADYLIQSDFYKTATGLSRVEAICRYQGISLKEVYAFFGKEAHQQRS